MVRKTQQINPVVNDIVLPWCCIFDIDGTLACMEHRSPYDFEALLEDTPNHAVINMLRAWQKTCPNDKIIIATSRPKLSEELTKAWLGEYEIQYDELYVLRPDGDKTTKDYELKLAWYKKEIEPRYNVRFVMDDRKEVCKMWYNQGLPLFRVGDPEATF